MKAKMVNPKNISDMDVINMKSQARYMQLMQMIGKGRRKIEISLTKASQKYLESISEEMKKQMFEYSKRMPNVAQFFDYLIKSVHVAKKQKRPKIRTILLSFEEQDFLVMQLRNTLAEIERQRSNLKWYSFVKKMAFKTLYKQNDVLLNEILKKENKK